MTSRSIQRVRGFLFAGMLAVGVLAGCTNRPDSGARSPEEQAATGAQSQQASGEPARLLLYCGAGIRWPVAELAEQFGREHHVRIECDYAGSEVLLSRIKLSGLGDLYMPGDIHYVEQAEAEGLVAEKAIACYFVPVILVQKGNPKRIRSLSDLLRPDVRLGLGDPQACAIGRKCRRIFEKNGIDPQRVARHVAFRSLTVNELGTNVAIGSLDAAIVWDAVAANFAEKTEVVPIAAEQNIISTVPLAVLRSSKHTDIARQFVEFVTSSAGQAVFKKHHYTTQLPRQPTGSNRP